MTSYIIRSSILGTAALIALIFIPAAKRSSRAISESCRVAGIPTGATPRSKTLLVNSSTKSGTPSVRSAI